MATIAPQSTNNRYLDQWSGNIVTNLLSGLVVALALIPEAIAFSTIAGVPPKVGLYASFIIAVVTAFIGGRPAMISAATGAMALVMANLVPTYGLELGFQYILATSVLCGIFQLTFGILKLGRYMRFIPKSVMVGFVNALGLLYFITQYEELLHSIDLGQQAIFIPIVLGGLLMIYGIPRFFKAIPSPLIMIVVMTAIAVLGSLDVARVKDLGDLPTTLPTLTNPLNNALELTEASQITEPVAGIFDGLPNPLDALNLMNDPIGTLKIILPLALALSMVGLIESLLTATIIDESTDTTSNKNQEMRAQGIANIIVGFFGGMAGCAMIGQSGINVDNGGRTRLSTLASGVFLLILILVLGNYVNMIPVAALVAVMVMVAINTFDWGSIPDMKNQPYSETVVMLVTTGIVVWTHNLAYGVIAGVVLACFFFTRKVAKWSSVDSELDSTGRIRTYNVKGQIYFVSTEDFVNSFDVMEDLDHVNIDLSQSQLWDATAVAAIDKVVLRFRKFGTPVTISGMNELSEWVHDKLATHEDPNATLGGH